ncbi:MucR family transcriptional regulator [Methylobacterium pseudosasicola]|uniref:Transcriptional regulator, MucR family n=1 Tax=Methylobacterium pseudosasicola TaxID=582667 RepID=A0A1I4RA44_9HYPH|nr:MucR family transcriptional regulator [Methylobacterium pseudosasicola]SFM48783.1 transcriptional regulator, MucR family [Methylobacterium pseudosasicola]
MPASTSASPLSLTDLATGIVSAYVSKNRVPVSELPTLITKVHDTIVSLATGVAAVATEPSLQAQIDKPSPAQIRKSVQQHGIISFIDGRSYKTLKRHLTAHGLHPRSYRERYGLPADYPMVAEEYAQHRSKLAKAIGLGVPGVRSVQLRTGTDG